MAFSITGSKYGAATVSSVGISTVTVFSAPFVAGDFAVTRLVGLWNSAGTTFKGMAWVRRFLSTSQLELESQFFDPATGKTVTQAVGDTILVSKNFAESVVDGLAISGRTVTITDTCLFGNTTAQGVCFYDESKDINTNSPLQILGGLTVFGKLDDYATDDISSALNVYFTTAWGSASLYTNNANSNFCMYGGVISGTDATRYIGGYTGVTGNTMIFNGVQNPFDFISPAAGGSWGVNKTRQQLVNCYSVSTSTNAITRRWGDGIIRGGKYKFPKGTSVPISLFGSDITGTYTVAANPGDRAVVLDMGNGPALVRGASSTWAFTNLITTDFRGVSGVSGSLTPNNGITNIFSFSDTYTGLQYGTVGVILDNTGAEAATNSATDTTWSPSLLRRTCVGATVTVNATSWTYGFKKYGYQAIGGSIAPSVYDLGTAGQADNVAFGGLVNQLLDTGVTLTQSEANALTTVVDLDQLYDASVAYGVASVPNAQIPSICEFPIKWSGDVLDAGAYNIVLTATGNVFSISGNSMTINSTILQKGAKFSKLKTTGTINVGAAVIKNITFIGNVIQDIPTDLSGVVITGTLTYNTNTATSINITNTTIGTAVNNGTGIVTINKVNSIIANYFDAEINFIDSTISVIGADMVTFHPTANDRDLNVNASGTFTGSRDFKFGSTINGSVMSGTLYLRCVAGGIPFNINKEIVLGDNLVDLGTTAQLASLSAKIDLTAKESSLVKMNDGLKKIAMHKPYKTDL